MKDLIAELENAEKGDRRSDFAIFWPGRELGVWHMHIERIDVDGEQHATDIVPHYTTSIDAALSLVPEGWSWFVGKLRRESANPGSAQLLNAKAEPPEYRECAATPALALCIAALKSREA